MAGAVAKKLPMSGYIRQFSVATNLQMTSAAYGGIMRKLATPPGSVPQAKGLGMSVPSHADVIVLHR